MKKKIESTEINPKCDYCIHNEGVGRLGYMWKCSLLGYCVVFGLKRCEAKYKGKGDFKIDKEKYIKWNNETNKNNTF